MERTEFTVGQIRPVECLKEGWALIKDEYWILFALSIVGATIAGISMYILLGPMVCGIFLAYLRKVDGGRVVFDDLFAGFKYFKQTILIVILFVVPIIAYVAAMTITVYLPLIISAIRGQRVSGGELLAAFALGVAVELVVAIIMVCIHSVLIFAFPLVIDRGLSNWDAIKLSFRAVIKNLRGVGGFMALQIGISLAGMMAFCVGVYFTIPILTALLLVIYRKIFPRLDETGELDVPPVAA